MADLRNTPSLQHAIGLMRDSVAATVLEMEKLDARRIKFSLNPGRRMFKPLMEGRSLDWALGQIHLEKRTINIGPNVELVTAFEPFARAKSVSWFRECDPHFYLIGGDLKIPVRPAGFWAEKGKFRVLWVQSWKTRTLDASQKAIFHTILRKNIFVGDFKNAQLEWVDLREKTPSEGRHIEILPGDALGTVTDDQLTEYIEILVAAFDQYSAAKKKRAEAEKASRTLPNKETPLFNTEAPKQP